MESLGGVLPYRRIPRTNRSATPPCRSTSLKKSLLATLSAFPRNQLPIALDAPSSTVRYPNTAGRTCCRIARATYPSAPDCSSSASICVSIRSFSENPPAGFGPPPYGRQLAGIPPFSPVGPG